MAGGPREMTGRELTAASVEAVVYAVVVLVSTAALALLATLVTGGDLVRMKTLLFVAGWLLVTYATVRLWPSSPEDVERTARRSAQTGRVQRVVDALVPVRVGRRRFSQSGKLFLGGVLVLVASLVMETVGGIS